MVREIEPSVDHNHCTTRQFQHMTFHHDGVWFVFYSDGQDFRYQTSADGGGTWRQAAAPIDQAPNGSSSFDLVKAGDTVYLAHSYYPLGCYDVTAAYATDPSRRHEYTNEGRVKNGRIAGGTIEWLEDHNPGFTPDYTNLVRDAAALDGGLLYVASVLTTDGKLYGNLYDGSEWGADATL